MTIQQLIATSEHAARYVPTATAQLLIGLAQACQQLLNEQIDDPRIAIRAEHDE